MKILSKTIFEQMTFIDILNYSLIHKAISSAQVVPNRAASACNVTKSNILQLAILLKVTPLHWSFSRFFNCTNGKKSRNVSHKKRPTHEMG